MRYRRNCCVYNNVVGNFTDTLHRQKIRQKTQRKKS